MSDAAGSSSAEATAAAAAASAPAPATDKTVQLPLLSWTLIENEFNVRFSKVFMGRNAKAYFDFIGDMVDGAKERWRSIQMLDALLCAVYNIRPQDIPRAGHRRLFEHHDVFRHSVLKAMEAAYDDAYGIRKGQIHPSANNVTGVSCGILCDIRAPWADADALKSVFLAHTTDSARTDGDRSSHNESKRRKGFAKRKEIIDAMTCVDVFQSHTLPEILVRAVERILRRVTEEADAAPLAAAEELVPARDRRLLGGKSFTAVAPSSHMRKLLLEAEPSSSSSAGGSGGGGGAGAGAGLGDGTDDADAWGDDGGDGDMFGVDEDNIMSEIDAARLALLLPGDYEKCLQPLPQPKKLEKTRESVRPKRKNESEGFEYADIDLVKRKRGGPSDAP